MRQPYCLHNRLRLDQGVKRDSDGADKADLREVSGGTFGAFLPRGASGGPGWDNGVNPVLDLAVDVGILLPAGLLYQDVVEKVVPAFEDKYKSAGINEDDTCFSY